MAKMRQRFRVRMDGMAEPVTVTANALDLAACEKYLPSTEAELATLSKADQLAAGLRICHTAMLRQYPDLTAGEFANWVNDLDDLDDLDGDSIGAGGGGLLGVAPDPTRPADSASRP